MLKELNLENYDSVVKGSKGLVVVDFWAPWCGPCKRLIPIMESIGSENVDDSVGVYKCNVDENGSIPGSLGVRNIPTIIFFKDGVAVDRVTGLKTKEEILDLIAKNK